MVHDQHICVLDIDGEEIGVMMGWEEGIMRETVRKLCLDHPKASGLKVLNIGFGLGIVGLFFSKKRNPCNHDDCHQQIDGLFQSLPSHYPTRHVIIEAHPDVLQHMRETGWYDKPGIKILEGKWQDFLDSDDLLSSGGFDVIYTDTFSEDYNDLRQFFEHLPDLMADADSRFSFFNGLGATSEFIYFAKSYNVLTTLLLIQTHLSMMYTHIYPSFILLTLDSMLIGAM